MQTERRAAPTSVGQMRGEVTKKINGERRKAILIFRQSLAALSRKEVKKREGTLGSAPSRVGLVRQKRLQS